MGYAAHLGQRAAIERQNSHELARFFCCPVDAVPCNLKGPSYPHVTVMQTFSLLGSLHMADMHPTLQGSPSAMCNLRHNSEEVLQCMQRSML